MWAERWESDAASSSSSSSSAAGVLAAALSASARADGARLLRGDYAAAGWNATSTTAPPVAIPASATSSTPTTLASIAAAAAAAAASAGAGDDPGGFGGGGSASSAPPAADEVVHCSLLSTSFGWWLQVFLGFACFVSLVGKRFTDRIRRPWKVWFMDTSKQGISAFMVHFLNILLSMALGRWLDADVDPCNWYWINLTLDDTLGVFIQLLFLKALKCVYRSRCVDRPDLADTGSYGDPPDWSIYFRQLLDWQALVVCQKLLMLVFVFKLTTEVGAVADVCLGWLDAWPRVKLVVVMVITPLTMNIFALWMADNFLQGDHTMSSRSLLAADPLSSPSVVGHACGVVDSSDGHSDNEGDGVVGFQEWKRRGGSRQPHARLSA